MKSLFEMFRQQMDIGYVRQWDHIYVAIDLHGTMVKANYSIMDKEFGSYEFVAYPYLFHALMKMSMDDRFKLILYTSSHMDQINRFLEFINKNIEHDYQKIRFDYINENPEVPNTDLGDFSKKFYFNILLDDKAGFCPETDWEVIANIMKVI